MSKHFLAFLMAFLIAFTPGTIALAADESLDAQNSKENLVVFSGISQLDLHETMKHVVIGPDGNEEEVGIEKVAVNTRSSSETWRVWYQGINSKSEFYMTVSNNQVTSVYDYSISITGGTYEDALLTSTSTYGKLTFKAVSLGGIISGTCWLKGTVTGSDNKIDVTWQM